MDDVVDGAERRSAWVRRALAGFLIVLALSLVACGGSSGTEDTPDRSITDRFPLVAGATMLDVATAEQDDLNTSEIDVSNVGAGIYKSTMSFDVVTDYYTNRIQSDGWTVTTSYPIGDATMYFLSNRSDVAIVTLAQGDVAKATPNLISSNELEFDPADLANSDTLIVVSHFTCEEESLAACLVGAGV